MTDRLPPLSTQIVAPSQTVLPVLAPVSVQDAPLKKQETVEEEPYTIKCICNFSDDDGNTIFCETCDTWQHIECFYPNNKDDVVRDDFSHSCADCKPRPLDAQRAHEKQKARLTMSVVEEETTDKKPKRPPSKSHKKRPKPTELQLSGHSPNSNEQSKHSGSHEHHPPKKHKSSHKTSQSISSQAPKRSPSYGNSKPNPAHPPSPATTPPDLPINFRPHHYSDNFISLHSEQDVQIVNINSYANLDISCKMSMWLRDQDEMRRETGHEFNDVFQRLPSDFDSRRSHQIEQKSLPLGSPGGRVLRLPYLAAVSAIEKDVPLMELNGQIGLQKQYCEDPANKWEELTTPLPFVFFHPMLPIYIDTRKEGSKARCVRRSCKPNSMIDTFLTDASEYHFWLVSDRHIITQEQITIPWDFRFPPKKQPQLLRLLGLGDEEASAHGEPEVGDSDMDDLFVYINVVLSEYGGCACDLGPDCAFARFRRSYTNRVQSRANPVPKKKSRKLKAQHTISPTSTGHATNSRAASEGHLEDVAEMDGRSQTGSSRSKPPSRDLTPARQGSFDTLGILTEPTDRDKRKVAMVEDSFRRMEQQQPPRKKAKRTSDGTGSSSSKSKPPSVSRSTGSHLSNGTLERRYVDAGTSRSKSHSPAMAASAHMMRFARSISPRHGSAPVPSRHTSVGSRANYCDAAVQTTPTDGDWYSESAPTPKPKKRIISLSKRLLNTRHQVRLDEEERLKQSPSHGSTTPMDIDSPTLAQGAFVSPTFSNGLNSLVISPRDGSISDPRAPGGGNPLKHRSSDLRVQMPPVPSFGGSSSFLASATTPLSATSPMMQSPFGSNSLNSPFGQTLVNGMTAVPSPVKKKMSLSDYKSRLNKVQAAKPSVTTASLKAATSNADEPKSASSLDTPVATASPTDGLQTS